MSNITLITAAVLENFTELTNNRNHLQKLSILPSYVNDTIHMIAYLFLAFALLPQLIHLSNHGSRYIAGISYMWIIIRVLGLMLLMTGHVFKWLFICKSIALISTICIFIQIISFSNSLHRQSKIILIVISLFTWLIGGAFFLFARKQHRGDIFIIIGYSLLAVHMLPQILLSSLLRTAKALSKLSLLSLVISDILLFYSLSTIHQRYVHLIFTYYSLSFSLFSYLQRMFYQDAHIHLISRSAHTILTAGVDVFTGLDANGTRSSGDEPQMFAIDDLELMNGIDVVYQPVTTNKSSKFTTEQTPMEQFVWYASLGFIFAVEILCTIILIYRAWSAWIIYIPLSIPVILGIIFLLRTKLSVLQAENLRKIL